MATFDYAALNQSGRQVKGIVEGDSSRHVRQILREQGLHPLEVSPAKKKLRTRTIGPNWFRRIGPLELALSTRQFSTLINAGLPIEEALSVIAQQTEKKRARSIFMNVRSKILDGFPLSDALAEFPATFDNMYRSTVDAGEQSGHLDSILENLATHLEEGYESKRNLETALYYPVLLLVTAVVIIGVLMTYVIPDIVKVFDDTGVELPAITIALITTSEFLRAYAWLLLILLGLVFIAIRWLLSLPSVRMAWDRQKIKMPFVGWLIRGRSATQYTNTLAILGSSGVSLVDGMRIATEIVGNTWLKTQLRNSIDIVNEGGSLRSALEGAAFFPPMFLHMIASGEASGELDAMLHKVSQYQQSELTRSIETMIQLFRPAMLLLMAGLVLMIMMAVLVPILNMHELVL